MSTRVLVIAPTPFFSDRGTPIRIFEEVRALRRLDIECVIATYPIGDTPEELVSDTGVRVDRVTNIAPWYTKRSAGASFTKIAFDLSLALHVRKLVATEHFDLIHAHNHEGIFIAWLAKQLSRSFIPVIADLHGSLSEEVSPRLQGFEQWLERIPHHIVTSSEHNTERVQAHRAAGTVTTVNDAGIESAMVSSVSREAVRAFCEKYTIPEDAFVVTYAGGYGAEKGTDILAELIPALLKKHQRIHCLLVGSVPLTIELAIKKSVTTDEWSRLHCIPHVPYHELPTLLAATHCAIDPKPANSHQASGKILNALAAGIPIVALDREYSKALLSPEQLVDPASKAAGFTKAILHFFDNPALAQKAQEHNRQKAEAYSWSTVGQTMRDLYTTVTHK